MRFVTAAFLLLAACSSSPATLTPDAAPTPDATPTDTTAPCGGLCGAGTVCDGIRCVAVDAGPATDTPGDAVADANDAATDGSNDAVVDAVDAPPACVDRDGDGYGAGCARGPDCDDTDAERHPGAVERCNGLDDDCDGTGDVERSAALDAWCTTLWRTQFTRRNFDPMRDHSYCVIPSGRQDPSETCWASRVGCAAIAYNPSSGCICFTAADMSSSCR